MCPKIFLSGFRIVFIWYGSGSRILGWIPIRIQGVYDQKLKKFTAEKKLNFLGIKTTIYLSLSLNKERPSYRRSLQISKEAIQHVKTWTFKKNFYFCGSFLPFWIRIHWPDWIRIQSGSATATLVSLSLTESTVSWAWKHRRSCDSAWKRRSSAPPQTLSSVRS